MNNKCSTEPINKKLKYKKHQIDFTLEHLGSGGNAHVYIINGVENSDLKQYADSNHVIKILHNHKKEKNGEATKRFKREIEAMLKLNGLEVTVPILDYDIEGADPWYIMPKCTSLEKEYGKFDIKQKIEILLSLANSLKIIHSKGYAHRDIKPKNILLDSNNRPLWADLGLVLGEDDSDNITSLHKDIGPKAYIANEIGHPELIISPRIEAYKLSDIKSFAKLIFAMFADGPLEGYYAQYAWILEKKTPGYPINPLLDAIVRGADLHPQNRCTIDDIISNLLDFKDKIDTDQMDNDLMSLRRNTIAFSSINHPQYYVYENSNDMGKFMLGLNSRKFIITVDNRSYECNGIRVYEISENAFLFFKTRSDGTEDRYYFEPYRIKIYQDGKIDIETKAFSNSGVIEENMDYFSDLPKSIVFSEEIITI